MYARGRRQDVAGERRDGGGGEHDKDLSHTLRARSGREGGMKLGRERGESRVRGREREADRQRHAGSGPGLSLAKVEAFASCQLETAALSQKDAALRHFCLLVCSPVFVCLSKRTAWRLRSAESSADVLKHETRTICVTGYT